MRLPLAPLTAAGLAAGLAGLLGLAGLAGCSSSDSPSGSSSSAAPSASSTASASASPGAPGTRTAQQLVLNSADTTGLRTGAASTAARTQTAARTLLACFGGAVNGVAGAASPDATSGRTTASSAAFVLADASRANAVLVAARRSSANACVSSYVSTLSGVRAGLAVVPQSAATGSALQVTGPALVADVRIQVGGADVVVLQVLTRGTRTAPAAHTALVDRFVATTDRRTTPTG